LACLGLAACSPDSGSRPGGDFAVLAQGAEGFEQARPGNQLVFPRDHGAHPGFRIEWWYLTANLQDAAGRQYGAQWTLFRTATRMVSGPPADNPWQDPQVYMAHLAITTPDDHRSFQRYARGGEHDGLAQAGVSAAPFMAWLDDWSLQSTGPGWLPLELRARQGGHGVELRLDSNRPLVLQGQQGFSQKHPAGGGSYYYSHPFLEAEGALLIDGQQLAVSGQAWLDREWSSQFLQADQAGWDWFALHLESGEKLMLFRLRSSEPGAGSNFRHGVLISPDGRKLSLESTGIEFEVIGTSRVSGRELPLNWRIALSQIGRELRVEALHPEQWMEVDFAYWEGVVRVSGDGPGSRGVGYLELTGYPAR
jgi:predicted secreted hydrolase